jgi:hypothetical protein
VLHARVSLTVDIDADKQSAINLFLGVHEHHGHVVHSRGSYQQWYQPHNLETAYTLDECLHALHDFVIYRGDFWSEYYRPLLFTSLGKHFAYCMNTLKAPGKFMNGGGYSPFLLSNPNTVHQPRLMAGVRRWIGNQAQSHSDIVIKSMHTTNMDARSQSHNKAETHTQTTGVLASQLLNPQVPQEELLEYHRYIDKDQLIHDAMQSEAEATDQLLYMKCIEKNAGKGELVSANGIVELYERYILSASGDWMSTLADTYTYTQWLAEVVTV